MILRCKILSALLIACSLSLLGSGCANYLDAFLPPSPYEFDWRSGWIRVDGLIMSSLESVTMTYENGYILNDKGKVALAATRITDYRIALTTTVLEGNGIRFRTRTTAEESDRIMGVMLDYSTKGIEIRDGTRLIAQIDTIKAKLGVEELIKIESDGNLTRIEIGCSKPFIFTTEQMGTEGIITESLPTSKVSVHGIEMIPLRLARPSIY